MNSLSEDLRRVLHVNDTGRLVGGAEVYLAELAWLLGQHGIESDLLISGQDPAVDHEMSERFTEVASGDLSGSEARRLLRQADLVLVHRSDGPVVRQLTEQALPVVRLVHDVALVCPRVHGYSLISGRSCDHPVGAACYASGACIRRSEGRWPVRLDPGRVLRKQRELVTERTLPQLVSSRFVRRRLLQNGFDPGRVFAVRPFRRIGDCRHQQPPLANRLLFVGQVVRGKGLDLLLRALERVSPSWHLDVVGDGSWWPQLRAQIEATGLGPRVTLWGRQPPDRLAEHYGQAQIVVVPSRAPESFGLVGLEAMAHGRPVVAFDVGGISEWLQQGVTGLLAPEQDVGGLARQLSRLLAAPEEARLMGLRGRRRYLEAFSPQATWTQLERSLRQIAVPTTRKEAA
jgi:glycosyltransferase involved in cell wall biosynthesis